MNNDYCVDGTQHNMLFVWLSLNFDPTELGVLLPCEVRH